MDVGNGHYRIRVVNTGVDHPWQEYQVTRMVAYPVDAGVIDYNRPWDIDRYQRCGMQLEFERLEPLFDEYEVAATKVLAEFRLQINLLWVAIENTNPFGQKDVLARKIDRYERECEAALRILGYRIDRGRLRKLSKTYRRQEQLREHRRMQAVIALMDGDEGAIAKLVENA